jgi:hypothetical protein
MWKPEAAARIYTAHGARKWTILYMWITILTLLDATLRAFKDNFNRYIRDSHQSAGNANSDDYEDNVGQCEE